MDINLISSPFNHFEITYLKSIIIQFKKPKVKQPKMGQIFIQKEIIRLIIKTGKIHIIAN